MSAGNYPVGDRYRLNEELFADYFPNCVWNKVADAEPGLNSLPNQRSRNIEIGCLVYVYFLSSYQGFLGGFAAVHVDIVVVENILTVLPAG